MAMRPPAKRARRAALLLSAFAVAFTIAFGFAIRRTIRYAYAESDDFVPWLTVALCLLLVAMLFRMVAAICELLWLERTWTNLPEQLRKVGPVEKVTSGLLVGLSVVPGVAWVWKLGLVTTIADGFEEVRTIMPFDAPVPKRLGMAAVIVGWIPGLNVYIAPFLWEAFATRIDVVVHEIQAKRADLERLEP